MVLRQSAIRITEPAMCQLLGMNCNIPTDICFSFSGFANGKFTGGFEHEGHSIQRKSQKKVEHSDPAWKSLGRCIFEGR
nr:class II glutamine amidotransferase [Geoalkalibacter subterraneus]